MGKQVNSTERAQYSQTYIPRQVPDMPAYRPTENATEPRSLDHYRRSLGALVDEVVESLTDTPAPADIGDTRAWLDNMPAFTELCRRWLWYQLAEAETITGTTPAGEYLSAIMRDNANECFGVLMLDTRHHVLGYEVLFEGTVDASAVYPRVVLQRVLASNASAIILCHNHPSGNAKPSRAELTTT